MEEFHCGRGMEDDQEGEWTEILQKWDEQDDFAAAAHGLPAMGSNSPHHLPTCTSMMQHLSPHRVMERLNVPVFLTPSPNSIGPSSTLGLSPSSLLQSPRPFTNTSLNQINTNPLSLETGLMDHFNSSADSLHTKDAEDLITSSVRQQDESGSDTLRSSWISTLLQSLQSQPLTPTGLSSSSASYSDLLTPRAMMASAAPTLYNNNPVGLEDMIEQMSSNVFVNYAGQGSLQEHFANANLCVSDMAMSTTAEMMRGDERGRLAAAGPGGNEDLDAQALLANSPATSVSSDAGLEDDSDSHDDIKDGFDMATSLDPYDDPIMQSAPTGDHPHLNVLPSAETHSSKTSKTQGQTSAAPSSSLDQDKKRTSKAARVTKKPKRERGAKLAIKIQSDVDVLDDGYKWRKYGQKAVKNSPYPRSYYKCTDKQCKVKKHVERQAHEPEYVVTTYEGVHNHSRPDQRVEVLHAQGDSTAQQSDSFQPFVPASSSHHLSPMEILGLRPSSLLRGESQPSQQATPSSQPSLDSIDQGILQTLLQGEPRSTA